MPGTEQCLKAFADEYRKWSEAKAKCESEGLALAKIHDDDALAIRKKMVDNGKLIFFNLIVKFNFKIWQHFELIYRNHLLQIYSNKNID